MAADVLTPPPSVRETAAAYALGIVVSEVRRALTSYIGFDEPCGLPNAPVLTCGVSQDLPLAGTLPLEADGRLATT